MFRRFITILAIFAVIALQGHTANAAIDEKGAEHLKQMFGDMLDAQASEAKTRGRTLKVDGEVMVEPYGSYYAVTLPHLSAENPDGSRFEIGMIAINAIPGDKKGQWKMTMALPTPLTHYDEAGTADLTISIGKQNFAGVWFEDFRNYTQLQAQYKDIVIAAPDGSFRASIPDLTAVQNLKENKPGLWSGPFQFTATAFEMADDTGLKAVIGKLSLMISLTDYSIAGQNSYREKLQALSESYEAGEESESASHMAGLYNLVTEFVGSVWDGFNIGITVDNVAITHPYAEAGQGSVKIGRASHVLGMSGFQQGNVTLNTGLSFDGLAITPPPSFFNRATPDRLDVNFSLQNLPYKDIVEMGRTTVNNAAKTPEIGPLAGAAAIMQLPQILTNGQTSLIMKNTSFGNADYNATAQGTFKPDMEAMKSVTGTGTVEVTGFEKLLAGIAQDLQDPKLAPEKAAELKQLQAMLTALQLTGQAKEGSAARLYNLELNREGKILLNGADISGLLQLIE